MAEALTPAGVEVTLDQGHPPITLRGPLRGGSFHMDGSLSSQFLTGMLMALPRAEGDSVLHVDNLQSRPYVDMTLDVLQSVGVSAHHEDYRTFTIPGGQRVQAFDQTVAGDWSAGPSCSFSPPSQGIPSSKSTGSETPQPKPIRPSPAPCC